MFPLKIYLTLLNLSIFFIIKYAKYYDLMNILLVLFAIFLLKPQLLLYATMQVVLYV